MNEGEVFLVVGLLAAFVMSMFLAAAEASLLRISGTRAMTLAHERGRRGRRLAELVGNLTRVLNAVLLTALLMQIAAATLTGILAQRWFGSVGVTVASGALTVLLFIYGEAIPKTYAVRHADRVALAVAGPILVLEHLLRPIVAALVWIADLQMPGKGITTAPTVTEDELRRLAARAAHEGEITERDMVLIHKAFRLGDLRADDIMVPRTDMVSVRATDSVEDALRIALASGHRRLPVRTKSADDIVGLVGIRDLVGVPDERRPNVEVGVVAQAPLLVPASKRVLDLLDDMQSSRVHLATVVDEYGGTAGLVTIEDIAEVLLGTISDHAQAEPIVTLDGGGWSLDATLPVEDFAELVGGDVPEGSWNTVAGLLLGLHGSIPQVGDEVEVAGHVVRIAVMGRRRINRVEVRPVPSRRVLGSNRSQSTDE